MDALISINPKYAFAILQGVKTVEFRKKPITKQVDRCFVYITNPCKAIYGYFTILEQEPNHPDILWSKYHDRGAIDRLEYNQYYLERSIGWAIHIKEVYKFSSPLMGFQLKTPFTPPQSYLYIQDVDDSILSNAIRVL